MTVRIDGSTGISGLDGSSSIPAIQGANNSVGIFYPSANTVAISTSGVERLRINSGGSVGIGTNAPDRALSIARSNATIGITNTEAFGGAMSIDAPLSGLAQIDIAGANALRFNTNSAERMRIDGSGRITTSAQPYSEASCSNAYAFGSAANKTVIVWNNITQNIGSCLAANGRFYCPVTGVYFISATAIVRSDSSTSSDYRISVNKNNNVTPETTVINSKQGGYPSVALSQLFYFNSGDYFDIRLWNDGATGNTQPDAGFSRFSCRLLG